MGMFGFFKKRKPVEIESVAFDDVRKWLKSKEDIFREEEQYIFGKISGNLAEFYVSIEEKLSVLEGIDIEGKKEHGRAKILVRQGLDKYIISVRVLLKDLKGLTHESLGKFAGDAVETFGRFEKMSARFYGRATYLVGDEMAAVRNEIRRFYNGLVEIFEKPLIENLKKVEAVKVRLDEIEKVKKNLDEVEEEIRSNDLGIDKLKKGVKRLKDEVEAIRKSSEYVAGLKARDEIKSFRIGIDREIGKLKDMIDFKRLTNVVHSNERELNIVKDYKDHFASEFSKDKGKRLFDLMSGLNMRNDTIDATVALIEELGIELKEKIAGVGLDYTVGKLEEVGNVEERIESLELKNIKANRRFEELKFKLKGMRNEVLKIVNDFSRG